MSGQRDDTEDLIAELSKLMATDSKPGAAARPAAPAPSPQVGAAPQTIRIPGVSQPVPANGSQPAVDRFDFARSPQPAPAQAAPSPSSWQDRLGGKPATNSDPLAAFPPASAPSDRQESSIGSGNWRPAIAPNEVEPKPAPSNSGFDFDFGFNRERPAPVAKPAANVAPAPVPPAPVAPRPAPAAAFSPASVAQPAVVAPRPVPQPAPFVPQPAPAPAQQFTVPPPPAPQPVASTRDAIADLIAAELGTSTQSTFDDSPIVAEPPVSASTVSYSSQAPASIPEAPAPRPAVAQPRPAPESDRFSTAPVFGLGNRPAGESPAPKPKLDPMDEIENLIGEAVRVELNMPQPQPHPVRSDAGQANRSAPAPQASPAVPPLGAQFAPRRSSLRDSEPAMGGADEAILAAAAASGNEVGRVDSPFDDDRQVRPRKASRRERQTDERQAPRRRVARDEEERSGGAFKQLVVPAIAGTILVAGGFALYWALGMSHHDGKAPVLTADATPAKTIPAKPAADSSAPHSVVMDELSGTAPPAGKENLVSRDQTAGTDAAQVASTTPAAAASADSGLANRKVRTVTVRPDGSIVSGDDSVAGATQLPVGRPNVPSLPGVSVANAAEAPSAGTAADATATDPTNAASTDAASAANPAMAGTVNADAAPAADNFTATADNSTAAGDPNAPIPLPPPDRTQVASTDTTAADDSNAPTATTTRPSSAVNAVVRNNAAKPMDLIGNLATSSDNTAAPAQQPARQAPAASADTASVDTAAPGSSVAHVQLSSQPSAAGAQSSAASLQKKFGSLWAGGKLQIVKVDLSKGTYYRVVLPTTSLQGAQQLCASIKSGGGDCIAANG